MRGLENKVAIVTGASRGIGRGIAVRLAQDGAALAVNYLENRMAAAEVVRAIESGGGSAVALQADIRRVSDIERLFADTVEHFGRVDIVIANAGFATFGPLSEVSESLFDRIFETNAKGTFFCIRAALEYLPPGGRIVCISTIGTVLNPTGGACYFGAKAATEQFCRTLAREAAPRGITINVVSPGFVDTDMLRGTMAAAGARALEECTRLAPLARLGQPDDVAGAVAFLVSDDARWITRQNIAVDGGIVAR